MYSFTTPDKKAKEDNDNGTESETKKYPNTPLQRYMQELQQYQRESMTSLYTNTVDRPCLRNMCIEGENSDDYFLTCNQPLSFLPFVKNDYVDDGDDWIQQHDDTLPMAGAYTIPTNCEYCGAIHVSSCDPKTCQRPKLFFRKKRPPFCRDPTKWDPITEFEIINEEDKENDNDELKQTPSTPTAANECEVCLYPSTPVAKKGNNNNNRSATKQHKDKNDKGFFATTSSPAPLAWMITDFFGMKTKKSSSPNIVK